MHRLFLFIKKIYVFVLFVILEVVALNYYASSTSYTKAKLLTASTKVTGGFHRTLSDVGDYFGLRTENSTLVARIAELETELSKLKQYVPDSTHVGISETELSKYFYTYASVINNSVSRQENYLLLDKGTFDGLKPNMALVTPDGCIVGYIIDCNDKFSVAISLLNLEFRTGGKIKGRDYFGSIQWDGTDNNYVTFTEVTKYADIIKGDTIVTGNSSIFPPDILIGTVESFELTQASYYDIKVKLLSPLSRLTKVLVVDYSDIQERMLLEENYF